VPKQRFPALPRVCQHCGAAWVQDDGRPPRDYCSTSCRNQAERQAQSAPEGHAAAAPEPQASFYTRRVRAKQYTITCAWCREVVTVEQYPGPPPRYCSSLCRTAAARDGAAERMRRLRARQQHAAPSVTESQLP
jgi:hypothetical protein